MDGYKKIIALIILGSVCLLFHACRVEKSLGVHLFQPALVDSGRTVLTAETVPVDSGNALLNTDTAMADQKHTPGLSLPLEDSASSEIQTPVGKPGKDADEIQIADTIVHSESNQPKDSIVNETIVSGTDTTEPGAAEITTSEDQEITPSAGREIIAGQDTIISLLKTLVSSMDSLRQAELRSGVDSQKWIEGWEDQEMQDLPDSSSFIVGSDSTAPDSLPSTALDSLPSTAPDSLPSTALDSLPSNTSDSLQSSAPRSLETRGPAPGELVMPAREVNASILTLTRGLETSLRTIQQQGQANSEMLKKMESEMNLLKKEMNKQSNLLVNEGTNTEFAGTFQGQYPATELQENRRDTQDMAGDTTDMTGQVQETFNTPATGSSEPSTDTDSLADPVALVTLQLKHYEDVKNLRDSIKQHEKEKAGLKQQLMRLQAEQVNATRDTVANAVYLRRMDTLRSDYERILDRKTDSIKMLEEEISGMVGDVGDVGDQREVVSFVVYYESSSVTGNKMEEFESKLELLPLSEVKTVYLSAFSDASGTEDANHYISEQRLDVLTDKLIGKGIDPLKIYRQNHGEKFASPVTEPLDRRVEIILRF